MWIWAQYEAFVWNEFERSFIDIIKCWSYLDVMASFSSFSIDKGEDSSESSWRQETKLGIPGGTWQNLSPSTDYPESLWRLSSGNTHVGYLSEAGCCGYSPKCQMPAKILHKTTVYLAAHATLEPPCFEMTMQIFADIFSKGRLSQCWLQSMALNAVVNFIGRMALKTNFYEGFFQTQTVNLLCADQ